MKTLPKSQAERFARGITFDVRQKNQNNQTISCVGYAQQYIKMVVIGFPEHLLEKAIVKMVKYLI